MQNLKGSNFNQDAWSDELDAVNFKFHLGEQDRTCHWDDAVFGTNDGVFALGSGNGRVPTEGLMVSNDARS